MTDLSQGWVDITPTDTSNNVNDVAVVAGRGLVVKSSQGGTIAWSDDLVNWTQCSGSGAVRTFDPAYINNTFIIPGPKVSTTGKSFTGASGLSGTVYSICYDGYNFVAYSYINPSSRMYTSPDAITWTYKFDKPSGYGSSTQITSDGSYLYIAKHEHGSSTKTVLISRQPVQPTGDYSTEAWQQISSFSSPGGAYKFKYINGYFLICTAGGHIMYSTDAVNWTQ